MRFLWMMIVLSIAGCPNAVNPVQPDASTECGAWCAHAKDMQCLASMPTEHGASCVDVCTNMQSGVLPFNLGCRIASTSCAAADTCENGTTGRARGTAIDAGTSAPTCDNWCGHARELGCKAAMATGRGAPCAEVCDNVQSGPLPFNLGCRIAAKTCAAADACDRH